MTDLERIGQRLVTGFPGTALTPELVQVVKEYKIGNIILFRENIASADQLRTLCADLQTLIRSETGHDAFIMIDQEGGAVTRLPESCINVPGSMALAAAGYNAGPGRPRNWRNGPVLDAAIWAENVPFTETRDYVKKVLANTTNYAAAITGQPQSLRSRLGLVGPKNTPVAYNKELP